MEKFLDISFWQNFVSNALATLVGVVIGIPVALLIDRRISIRQQAQNKVIEKERAEERKKTLLKALYLTMSGNKLILERLHEELQNPKKMIYFNVETQLLESTSSVKYEIIDDLKLCAIIDADLYRLKVVSKLIDTYMQIGFSSYQRDIAGLSVNEVRSQLGNYIINEIADVREDIYSTMTDIAKYLPPPENNPNTNKS